MVIRAKIVINSPFFKGSFFVSFPKDTFLSFYEKVVMEKHEAINEENRDFAAEMANIIYGQAKNILSGSGVKLDMVIPAVDTQPSLHSNDPIIVIPFDMELGRFYIKVAPGYI